MTGNEGGIGGRVFISRDEFLPFFRPDVSEQEIAAVAEVLRSGWLTYGAKVREFGRACADYLQVPRAEPVSSCTAGLHLALEALEVGPGHEVILPALTFVSTLSAVVHRGAKPVLADVDPVTLCMSPDSCRDLVTPRTRAIIPVDMGGHPCDMAELRELATANGLRIVRDAAHSFGAREGGRLVGSGCDATVFSFYATKCITTGDGGLVTCDDDHLADRIARLGFHGMDGNAWQRYGDKGRWYYEILEPGWKYHLSDPAAALGLGQLARADEFMARRTSIARSYSSALADLPGVTVPRVADGMTSAWHLYLLRVDPDIVPGGRDRVIADLTANRIGSSVHFIPLHHHPAFRELAVEFGDRLPETEHYFRAAVSLPLFPAMTPQDVDDVVTVVRASIQAAVG